MFNDGFLFLIQEQVGRCFWDVIYCVEPRWRDAEWDKAVFFARWRGEKRVFDVGQTEEDDEQKEDDKQKNMLFKGFYGSKGRPRTQGCCYT